MAPEPVTGRPGTVTVGEVLRALGTVPGMMRFVAGFGVVTAAALAAGFGNVGGLLALVQLCGLVGAPLAMILDRHVRSASVVVALSIALSMALSALAVQLLIWFSLAYRVLLVITATAYGLGLASLLVGEREPDDRALPER
ncbi:MAG: hypothetical protein R2761_05035 [Acidimicrobiales bacterium]